MGIITIESTTSTRFVRTKSLILLRLTALLLDCRIKLRTLRGIVWRTLVALITLGLRVRITLLLVPFLGLGGLGPLC